MNARAATTPSPANRAAPPRRGFVFILVLGLLVLGSIMLGVALSRASNQTLAVQRQIDNYRRHHELLGVLDVVEKWLKDQPSSKIREHVINNDVIYRMVVSGDIVIVVRVFDGQGRVLTRIDQARDHIAREWLLTVLSRMPHDQPELFRSQGPTEISLLGAPEPVIRAIAGDSDELYEGLRAAQEAKVTDGAAFLNQLTKAGVASSTAQDVMRVMTLDPKLYRLEAEVVQGDDIRLYEILMTGDNKPVVLELKSMPRGSKTFEQRMSDPTEALDDRGERLRRN